VPAAKKPASRAWARARSAAAIMRSASTVEHFVLGTQPIEPGGVT
jgi:hypothetical protein